jgi:hypothetical protein
MGYKLRFIGQMSMHLFKNSFVRGLRKTIPKGFLRFQGSSPSCRLYEPEAGLVIRNHVPDEPWIRTSSSYSPGVWIGGSCSRFWYFFQGITDSAGKFRTTGRLFLKTNPEGRIPVPNLGVKKAMQYQDINKMARFLMNRFLPGDD